MALIKTEKLIEFAKDGQKSIQGLSLLLGFPRDEKPAREWFNYLFNKTFFSINSLIDEIEELRKLIEFLQVKDDFEVTNPEVTPPVTPTNPVGTWILKTPPGKVSGNARGTSNVAYLEHSSGLKVSGITVATTMIRSIDNMRVSTWANSKPFETSELGLLRALLPMNERPDEHPTMEIKITAPNTTDFIQTFNIWNGVPMSSSSGGGGNANQTE